MDHENSDSPNNIGEKLFASLQENIKLFESVGEEVKFQTRTLLDSQIQKMDLVTHEEFRVALNALERAEKRIVVLEKELQDRL